jgi:hypothetical protein
MITAALPAPAIPSAGDEGTGHIYCCDEKVAMCGADLTGVPEGREFPTMCRTCVDAETRRTGCPVPGCQP